MGDLRPIAPSSPEGGLCPIALSTLREELRPIALITQGGCVRLPELIAAISVVRHALAYGLGQALGPEEFQTFKRSNRKQS